MTDALLTLDDAAKLIPGADANTLKRMQRAGKLTCYRPGRAFVTTAANVREAIEACRVVPKVRTYGCTLPGETPPATSPTRQLGLSSTDLAATALDSALAQASKRKTKR